VDVDATSVDPTNVGYVSPTWDGKIELQADLGLDLQTPTFLRWLGVPRNVKVGLGNRTLFSKNVVGSPDVAVQAVNTGSTEATCTYSITATLKDKAIFPLDYGGTTVNLWAFSSSNRLSIGSLPLSPNGTASWTGRTTWTAPAAVPYSIQALSPDKLLGFLGLPDAGLVSVTPPKSDSDSDDPDCD
jgi:hypothetical protein